MQPGIGEVPRYSAGEWLSIAQNKWSAKSLFVCLRGSRMNEGFVFFMERQGRLDILGTDMDRN